MLGMLTGDRMVRLEVSGGGPQNLTRRNHYVVTVPYKSMSKTMQNIMRSGGRVTGVHLSNLPAARPSRQPEATLVESKNPKGKKKK